MASIVFNKDMSERREYVCHTCAKAFKRSEHCIRHQRAHTNEKPFQCRFCDRRYARKDLVCRHEKTLHAEGLAARRRSLATQKDAESPARPEVLQAEDDENHSHNDDNGSPNRASEFPGPVPPASPPVLMSGPEFALPEISPRNYSSGSPPQHVTVDSTMFAFSASDTDEALLVDTSYISAPVENPSPFRNTLDHFDFTGPFSDFPMVPLASFNNDGFLASADLVSLHRDLQSENLDFSVAHNINAGLHANALTPPHTGPDQDGICQRQGAAGQSRYAPTMYQSPDVVYVDLPIIAKTPHSKPLCPRVTDSHRERLVDQILLQGSTFGDFSESDLPKATLLSQYLRTFVDSFGVHMPFIHVPTFCPGSAHGALILVMCAIGALMRLEQEVATRLSIHADLLMQPEAVKHIQHDHGSKRFKHLVVPSKEVDPAACLPVWFVQSKLLITWFRAFTGNPHVVAQALNDTAFLVSAYRKKLNDVRADSPRDNSPSPDWHSWCYHESTKRLLHSILIFSNLLTTAYGITPLLSASDDGSVELPCSDPLWDAPNREIWQERLTQASHSRQTSLQAAVVSLMDGTADRSHPTHSLMSWSPFAAVIVLHGVSIQMWHSSQFVRSIARPSLFENLHQDLQTMVMEQNAKSLGRCHEHILRARDSQGDPWTEGEGPLLFNCCAILRLAHLRAFADVEILGTSLLQTNAHRTTEALQRFLTVPQPRSMLVVEAVGQIFEGLILPSTSGSRLLIQKTAALTWSLEIAILAGSSCLYLMRWLHMIEVLIRDHAHVETSERALHEHMRATMLEMDLIEANPSSLAADIGRHYAAYYDDTWVWGITPRIAHVMRELAHLCESNVGH